MTNEKRKILKEHYSMHYSPKDKWMWDLWFLQKEGTYHMFYLQSEKHEDPEHRHQAHPEKLGKPVTVGYAVSKDLINWEEKGTVLEPTGFTWDEASIWTGSIIEKDGKYYKFYTGRDKNKLLVQKIGLAISEDLINWKKHENNPILEADNVFYEMENKRNALNCVPAFRDPYVFKDPKTGKYYKTISARKKGEKKEYNACIALAESDDLINWKLHPPILAPDRYDEMETSQLVYSKGKYYLFFCTHFRGYHPAWAAKHGAWTGLHCYYSENIFGPYKPVNKNGLVLSMGKYIYGVRLLENGDSFKAIGWLNYDDNDQFIGKLGKPFKIIIEEDTIVVEGDPLEPIDQSEKKK